MFLHNVKNKIKHTYAASCALLFVPTGIRRTTTEEFFGIIVMSSLYSEQTTNRNEQCLTVKTTSTCIFQHQVSHNLWTLWINALLTLFSHTAHKEIIIILQPIYNPTPSLPSCFLWWANVTIQMKVRRLMQTFGSMFTDVTLWN